MITTKAEALRYLTEVCKSGEQDEQTTVHHLIFNHQDILLEDFIKQVNAFKADREGNDEPKENQKEQESTNPNYNNKDTWTF